MNKAIIGKKIGMTQIFDENGKVIPVTVVEAGPCVVSQIKNLEKDGYAAIQVGFQDMKLKYKKEQRSQKFAEKPANITLPLQGHFIKADVAPKRFLREFRVDNIGDYKIGDLVKVDIFNTGDQIDVTGTSKGKGTAGVIKRWNFRRLKETHGTGPCVRTGGSMGCCSDPSRVFKGKKMAGHLGCERVTVQNLTVIKVDAENNLIAIKGAVPGPNGGTLLIRGSIKAKKRGMQSA
ncbi:MAG: 50S ribosomal protein L3 [Oscillospiraceae bacterium]|jgi:large subunit ribosomal protein L3|nr:50S ribosomal protein L3 [Oscillospiraceae bacterium]